MEDQTPGNTSDRLNALSCAPSRPTPKSIATNSCLTGFSPETLERCRVPQSFLSLSGLSQLRQLGTRIEEAHQEAASAQTHWKTTGLLHPERFTIEEACDLASRGNSNGAGSGHLGPVTGRARRCATSSTGRGQCRDDKPMGC